MPKTIRFDYFKVYARSFNQERNVAEEGLCNLSEVFEQLMDVPVARRVFSLGNDTARLQSIAHNNDKWELHFLRIRKAHFPVRANDNGDFGFFDDLTEEEGFGEEISVLFDPTNSTIMVRRNYLSLSPSAISDYLTDVVNQVGFTVFFKPLVHPRSLELIKDDHLVRSAEIAVADVKNANPSTKRSLGNILNKADEIEESVNVIFKIGLAQKGSRKYSKIPIYEDLIGFANDENVKKAIVTVKSNEDARVETFDLLQDRLIDYHNFPDTAIDPESRNILHVTVIGEMQRIYRTRLNDINNIYV